MILHMANKEGHRLKARPNLPRPDQTCGSDGSPDKGGGAIIEEGDTASNSSPYHTASGAAGQHLMKMKICTLAMFAPLRMAQEHRKKGDSNYHQLSST